MKKEIILLLLVLSASLCNTLKAQDTEGDDPAPGVYLSPDPKLLDEYRLANGIPALASSSVIFYSDGIQAALEFSPGAISGVKLVNKSNASDVRPLSLQNNRVLVTGLPSGQQYEVKAAGPAGVTYTLGVIQTTPWRAGDPVAVSDKLYRALSEYVAVEGQQIPFSRYVRDLEGITVYEKIAFVQRYAMNGAVLPASTKGLYPESLVKSAFVNRSSEGPCLCNFVMNQISVATPDTDGPMNYSIGPRIENTSFTHYNEASFWYRGGIFKGPAKQQILESTGHLAGNKRRMESWTIGEGTLSENSARIGYHLLCLSTEELPEACDCAKTVKLSYGYYSTAEARTNTGGQGCIFQQDASAQTQDWAVAFVTRENVNDLSDVRILGAGSAVATSTCKGGVPLNIITDILKIGAGVTETIISVKTGQIDGLADQIRRIADDLDSMLLRYNDVKECSSALVSKPLCQGTANITLRPNDPVSCFVMSGSSLGVSGRRCWHSTARVNSSFHLTGVLTGGSPSPSAPHCCTDYMANWIWGSLDGSQQNRMSAVSSHLALNNPGGWGTINGAPNAGGVAQVYTEIGYAIGVPLPPAQRCQKEIPLLLNPQ